MPRTRLENLRVFISSPRNWLIGYGTSLWAGTTLRRIRLANRLLHSADSIGANLTEEGEGRRSVPDNATFP